MMKIIISIITVLIFLASYLAGHEYNKTEGYDLLNQTCWVGFCLIICILLHESKQRVLLYIWLVLLAMSALELEDEYSNLNLTIRGADYINLCFALLSITYIIFKFRNVKK